MLHCVTVLGYPLGWVVVALGMVIFFVALIVMTLVGFGRSYRLWAALALFGVLVALLGFFLLLTPLSSTIIAAC